VSGVLLDVALEVADPARKGETNHFISPRSKEWLPADAAGRLVRLHVQVGRKVLVSDDFELRPPSHDHESK